MEKKIRALAEFAADHEIMIQNMNRRLKLVENIGALISVVSIISLGGLIYVILHILL